MVRLWGVAQHQRRHSGFILVIIEVDVSALGLHIGENTAFAIKRFSVLKNHNFPFLIYDLFDCSTTYPSRQISTKFPLLFREYMLL